MLIAANRNIKQENACGCANPAYQHIHNLIFLIVSPPMGNGVPIFSGDNFWGEKSVMKIPPPPKKRGFSLPVNRVICGDNIEVVMGWSAECVDAIVTDPPYGLGFMGKEWDKFGMERRTAVQKNSILPAGGAAAVKWESVGFQQWFTIWAKAMLRITKPGGFLLCFGGTRTFHRLTCAIEDAGWEIRDCMMWLYGSGFPKSLNISKAVDKQRQTQNNLGLLPDEKLFCDWMRNSSGISPQQAQKLVGSDRFITGEVKIVNTATTDNPRMGRRAMVPTSATWEKLLPYMNISPPNWICELVKNPPQPPIEHPGQWKGGKGVGVIGNNEWAGYGTGLKPAWEPIIVAMKPKEGSFAQNAEKYGVAGLNIDGGRISYQGETPNMGGRKNTKMDGEGYGFKIEGRPDKPNTQGRWPANLILDEEAGQMLDEQSGVSKGGFIRNRTKGARPFENNGKPTEYITTEKINELSGGASRFFYCAKTSRKERNMGLDNIPEQITDNGRKKKIDNPYLRGKTPRHNNHPTVKPLALMKYLCILLKMPGQNQIILDPFMGSGTTGMACKSLGINYIGIEKEQEYCDISIKRIAAV